MTAERPEERISVKDALAWFNTIRSSLPETQLKWRLRGRDESAPVRVIFDTIDVAKHGLQQLSRFLLQ